jgi:ribosome recycling factor
MDLDEVLLEAEDAMEKAVEFMTHEFASIRTGKASPALVENLDVEAYGSMMKLKQVALITTPEARLIVIQPFDASTTRDIERAINESRLGIAPAVDGKIIRIPIPELSEERRRDLVKTIKQISEESKVRVRACRREAMDSAKKMQKDGDITEDDLRGAEEDIQKLTDTYVAKVEHHVSSKEAEIMKV